MKNHLGFRRIVAGTVAVLICALILLPRTGLAQLVLDSGFGDQGKITTSINGFTDEGAAALAVDAQGRVLTAYAGLTGQGVSRHAADGSLDPSFGDGGIRRLDFAPTGLVLQADGKIVVVGSHESNGLQTSDWAVARLLANGNLDTSFAAGGELTLDWYGNGDFAMAVALDVAGNILVGGQAYVPGYGSGFALLKLDTSGSVLQQIAKKIYADTADFCQDVLVQADGKIVCAGLARNFGTAVMVAVRFQADLQLDTSFGTDGVAVVTFPGGPAEANSAQLLATGAIILGGFVSGSSGGDRDLALARLTSSGALDTAFGSSGRVVRPIAGDSNETIEAMQLFQGSLYVTASTHEIGDFALLRFAVDGTPDNSFGNAGLARADFNGKADSSRALTVFQGALLVGGAVGAVASNAGNDIGLARFLPGGALDTSFGNSGLSEVSLRGPVNATALDAVAQADGKIVAAGHVGISFSDRDFALARYRSDGSLDPAFGQQGIVTTDFANGQDNAMAVAVQADGKMLAAGEVRIPPATSNDVGVARYTASGALDSSFGSGGKMSLDVDGSVDTVRALAVQDDGRILLAGDSTFPSQGNLSKMTVIRLLANGLRDTTFGSNGVANVSFGNFDEGHALAVQSDGKILVGGIGDSDFAVARFLANGQLDTSFGSGGMVTHDFAGQFDFLQDLRVLPDWNGQGERILAVGSARATSSASSEAFAALMLDLDGNPEAGFGSNGAVVDDLLPGQAEHATAAALVNGRIVLAGEATVAGQTDFAMLGLTLTGNPDASFSGDGSATFVDFFASSDTANAIVIGSSGRIVLVGSAFDPAQGYAGQMFALARFADADLIFSDGFESP